MRALLDLTERALAQGFSCENKNTLSYDARKFAK